jgi:hypothetical protein
MTITVCVEDTRGIWLRKPKYISVEMSDPGKALAEVKSRFYGGYKEYLRFTVVK